MEERYKIVFELLFQLLLGIGSGILYLVVLTRGNYDFSLFQSIVFVILQIVVILLCNQKMKIKKIILNDIVFLLTSLAVCLMYSFMVSQNQSTLETLIKNAVIVHLCTFITIFILQYKKSR